ncbi:unnamed protein product, partial [Prorocentrum cordatum]
GASPNAPAAWSARGAPAVRRAAGAECGRWRATATGARRCAARPRGCAPGVAGSALGLVAGCRLLAAAACSEDGSASQEREAESRPSAEGRRGRNKERRYRDKGSESVTKNPYRSLLVLRRCVLKQHCLARERHPERSLPAPMEHCHFASGARQLWRGAPTRNETRIERGRRRRSGCGEGGGHETRKRGPPGRARSARAALARPPAGAKGTLTKNKTKQNGAAESGGVSEGRAGEAGPAALKRTRRWQQGGNHLQHVATATSTRTKRIARSATVPPGTLRRGRMPKAAWHGSCDL